MMLRSLGLLLMLFPLLLTLLSLPLSLSPSPSLLLVKLMTLSALVMPPLPQGRLSFCSSFAFLNSF
jgi:hypothetical protein